MSPVYITIILIKQYSGMDIFSVNQYFMSFFLIIIWESDANLKVIFIDLQKGLIL